MTSPSRLATWRLLTLAMLLSISACATQPPPSEPPLIVSTPKPAPLPANVKAIDPTPSTASLQMASDFLDSLEKWSARAAVILPAETLKSKP